MSDKNKRSRADINLRRVSRAVIQLAQAQAEVEAEALHLKSRRSDESAGRPAAFPPPHSGKDAA